MPWNMRDYPASMKNFEELERKKMIDIANALVASGYEDDRAIPIAIQQGKEWFADASDEEKRAFDREPNPSVNDEHDTRSANPDLLDEDVAVYFEDDVWKVKTVKAKQAADTFDTKAEALDRAQEIADNKGTKVISYRKDGSQQ